MKCCAVHCCLLSGRPLNVTIKISVEHWWNGTDGTPKYREKNLAECNFVYHKSQMD
jgi:hypothetical protein